MKLRKEFIIGLVVIFISVAMFYGIRFIQGSNMFLDSIKVHASYPQINNLQVGNPIYINGLRVGLVTATEISHDKDAHIEVDLTLETKYPIPNNSKAEIMELGVMGGMAIEILLGDSKSNLKDGDNIQSSIRMGMMDKMMKGIAPVADKTDQLVNKVEKTLDSFKTMADKFSSTLDSIEVKSQLRDINEMVNSFTKTSKMVQASVAQMSDSLSAIDYQKINELTTNINELSISAKALMDKVQTEDGSINQLLSKPDLYNNLEESSKALEILLKDLKAHPKRYVHFSVFGKKDKTKKE